MFFFPFSSRRLWKAIRSISLLICYRDIRVQQRTEVLCLVQCSCSVFTVYSVLVPVSHHDNHQVVGPSISLHPFSILACPQRYPRMAVVFPWNTSHRPEQSFQGHTRAANGLCLRGAVCSFIRLAFRPIRRLGSSPPSTSRSVCCGWLHHPQPPLTKIY